MQQDLSFLNLGHGRNTRRSSLALIVALHLLIVWFMLQKTGKITLFTYEAPSRITQVSMLSSGAGSSAAPAADIAVDSMPAPAMPRLDFGPSFTIKAEATTEDAAIVHASPRTSTQAATPARNEPATPPLSPPDRATAATAATASNAGSAADRSAGPGTGAGTLAGKGAGSSVGPDAFESLPVAVLAIECDTPAYPLDAMMKGQEGVARMALLIDAQGRVAESRIIKSTRSFSLDRASREAIALCRFVPPMQNGVAVGGWVSLKYTWRLRESMGVFRDGP
ncbi:energy transducer TonB [Rugamonas rivuli]|uniref:TonB family protein n=1 Tax=Rugamonas rivuli TaxID=2743358 RepID=A0A843S9Q2_9BURK|nr:energy transducer TonB [Rugamonas rivuli]MQA18854.1 TonB family protein [Rugamonas rivuli]